VIEKPARFVWATYGRHMTHAGRPRSVEIYIIYVDRATTAGSRRQTFSLLHLDHVL
jgi:hypothetical protein